MFILYKTGRKFFNSFGKNGFTTIESKYHSMLYTEYKCIHYTKSYLFRIYKDKATVIVYDFEFDIDKYEIEKLIGLYFQFEETEMKYPIKDKILDLVSPFLVAP